MATYAPCPALRPVRQSQRVAQRKGQCSTQSSSVGGVIGSITWNDAGRRRRRRGGLLAQRCIAPGDEREYEQAASSCRDITDADSGTLGALEEMDTPPVLVEDIQQHMQQEEDAAEQLLMATAIAAEGGGIENAIISGNFWPWITMDSETSTNFWSMMGVLAFFSNRFFSVDRGMERGWSVEEFIYRTCVDNWGTYQHFLHHSPILTKACTSCVIYAFCDWLAQTMKSKDALGFERTSIAHNAMIGLLAHGPISHFWYLLSDSVIPASHTWYGWIPKMIADQTIYAFAWNVLYMALIGSLKGQDMDAIKATIRKMWWPLQREGWKFWPFVHIITYNFIPRDERVLWVDLVELVWIVIFLSILENSKDQSPDCTPVE